jgi:hypothetical protein
MPAIDPQGLPPFQRPVRIPQRIEILPADPPCAVVGETSSWRLSFRLAEDLPAGSSLRLQIFGGRNNKGSFKPLQTDRPGEDGYVTARTAEGAPLEIRTDLSGSGPVRKSGQLLVEGSGHPGLLALSVPDGGLAAGTVLEVTLGDRSAGGGGIQGPSISALNKFFVLYRAEGENERPHFWGEENWDLIVAACTLHVLGGDLRGLRAYAPSTCAPGDEVIILVRPEDERGSLSHQGAGALTVSHEGRELGCVAEGVPDSVCVRLRLKLPEEGVYRLVVRDAESGLEATTNPIVCRSRDGDAGVYWGMIHGHTEMSDGTGTIENYFRQARDEAALDFAAPGDHDHTWETSDAMWYQTSRAVARWNDPGRFVTFLGYEWAKWRRNGDGDRNVYYLGDDRPLYRSDEGYFPTPADLFLALRAETAIVIPHHTGHFGNWCDFKDHDPEHERLIEIFQCRGSYECADGPAPEKAKEPPKTEGFVSRALELGWRVGFTAGGDDHVGHAGTEFLVGPYKSGLMSVLAGERTRAAIWDALRNRRVVATTGPRILLNYTVNGEPLGSELSPASQPELSARRQLRIEFHGTAPAARIEVVRCNRVVAVFEAPGIDCRLDWVDEEPLDEVALPAAKFRANPFVFYYVRAVQTDGEVAWASPVWLDI